MNCDEVMDRNENGRMAPELKTGVIFCIVAFALSIVTYCMF